MMRSHLFLVFALVSSCSAYLLPPVMLTPVLRAPSTHFIRRPGRSGLLGCIGSLLPKKPFRSLTEEEIATYRRDGVVLVRGLLSERELEDAQVACGGLLDENKKSLGTAYTHLNFQGWRTSRPMRKLAMDSSVPHVAAQALCLDEGEGHALRVMKDAMLAFSPGNKGCGWHVDDKFFWPTEDVPVGSPLEGCNIWITLTPVRRSTGGGLAVSPGSFNALWREETRGIIATKGPKGFAETCSLAELSPEHNARVEGASVVHDMEPGDALLCARYCFHRADPFVVDDAPTRVAYSVRYERADARMFDNGFERAVKEGRLSGGDKIERAGAYYPQVWPRSKPLERLAVKAGAIKPEVMGGG